MFTVTPFTDLPHNDDDSRIQRYLDGLSLQDGNFATVTK